VTTPLPELYPLQGLLRIADSPSAFEHAVAAYLADPGDARARRAVAADASWERRVDRFHARMVGCLPSLDVVVLTHQNAELTRRCVASVLADPSYEATLIVVDNASTDETPALLDELEREPGTIVRRNTANAGFAAGLNQGIRAGRGRYVLVLNNDTELPRGALLGVANALARSREVGLLGPVTNSIGNEAEIYVPYEAGDSEQLDAWFRTLAWQRFGMRFDLRVAALFAAVCRRDELTAVGGIPERYQVGMFEDDELSERFRAAGKRVVCAEDVFVHHAGAASFSTLDPVVYQAIFDRNRRIFESATGATWQHQRYRIDKTRPAGDPDGVQVTEIGPGDGRGVASTSRRA
jgi:GT2 family glycosyltransferase